MFAFETVEQSQRHSPIRAETGANQPADDSPTTAADQLDTYKGPGLPIETELRNPSSAGGGGSILICASGLLAEGKPFCLPSDSSSAMGSSRGKEYSGRRWSPRRLELGLIGASFVDPCESLEFACIQPASYPFSRSLIRGGGGNGGGAKFVIVFVRIGTGPWEGNDWPDMALAVGRLPLLDSWMLIEGVESRGKSIVQK